MDFKDDYALDEKKAFEPSESDDKGNIKQRYEKAILYVSSKDKNIDMKKTAEKTTVTSYNSFLNNCIENVEATLKAGDFKTGIGN